MGYEPMARHDAGRRPKGDRTSRGHGTPPRAASSQQEVGSPGRSGDHLSGVHVPVGQQRLVLVALHQGEEDSRGGGGERTGHKCADIPTGSEGLPALLVKAHITASSTTTRLARKTDGRQNEHIF